MTVKQLVLHGNTHSWNLCQNSMIKYWKLQLKQGSSNNRDSWNVNMGLVHAEKNQLTTNYAQQIKYLNQSIWKIYNLTKIALLAKYSRSNIHYNLLRPTDEHSEDILDSLCN